MNFSVVSQWLRRNRTHDQRSWNSQEFLQYLTDEKFQNPGYVRRETWILTTPYSQCEKAIHFSVELLAEWPDQTWTQLKEIHDQSANDENITKKTNCDEHRLDCIVETHCLENRDEDRCSLSTRIGGLISATLFFICILSIVLFCLSSKENPAISVSVTWHVPSLCVNGGQQVHEQASDRLQRERCSI